MMTRTCEPMLSSGCDAITEDLGLKATPMVVYEHFEDEDGRFEGDGGALAPYLRFGLKHWDRITAKPGSAS